MTFIWISMSFIFHPNTITLILHANRNLLLSCVLFVCYNFCYNFSPFFFLKVENQFYKNNIYFYWLKTIFKNAKSNFVINKTYLL